MTRRVGRLVLFFLVALSVSAFGVGSQTSRPSSEYRGQTVWQLPETDENDIDIGLWALIIAKEFDPSVDIAKLSTRLDSCAEEIRRMLANRATDRDKFAAVRMFLHDPGIWNGQHPFEYDLDDPLGKNLPRQLLSTYLESRRGNCVSMPTLFYALVQRVDPRMRVVALNAPLHLFCRVKDRQTGDIWNFEATNGTVARNIWYIETMNIPQKGIDSGIYMRELSKREFLGELVSILVHQQRERKEFRKALQYADLVSRLNPKSITNVVQMCALNAELGYPLYMKKKRGNAFTVAESNLLKQYLHRSRVYHTKACSLGWRPETPEEREKYLQMAKREQLKSSQP